MCNGFLVFAYTLVKCKMKGGVGIGAFSFEYAYDTYYKNVYNYVSFRINNHFDAEEIVSGVFEKAYTKFGTYSPERAGLEAWLIGISKNVVTDYLRRKKRRFFVPLDEIFNLRSEDATPDDIAVRNEENRGLIAAMAKLGDRERQILSMKFASGLKNVEIADTMGVSESNVGVTAHRALKKLMKYLEE